MRKKEIKWLQFLFMFTRKMNDDRVRAFAAESAFFLMMSALPFVMLLLTAVQFTPLSQEQTVQVMEYLIPFDISESLKHVVNSIYNQSFFVLVWNLIVAAWSSGKGVIGLSDGLNSVHRFREKSNYIILRIRAFIYTVLLLIAMILAIGILIFGYRIQQLLREYVPAFDTYPEVYLAVQLLTTMTILTLLFQSFYAFLPKRRLKFFYQLPGAVFTSVSWAVFSYAFSIYLGFASNMSVIYGGLTTLIVVMLWLYSCMYLFFIGAEINCFLESPLRFYEWSIRKGE